MEHASNFHAYYNRFASHNRRRRSKQVLIELLFIINRDSGVNTRGTNKKKQSRPDTGRKHPHDKQRGPENKKKIHAQYFHAAVA